MFDRRVLLASLALALASSGVAQTTWYVDDDGTAPGSGTPGDPYTSIQYALDQPTTVDGDVVHVYPGTYFETLDTLGKAVHLRGDAGEMPLVDALGTGPVISIHQGEGSDTVVEGFELSGGVGNPCGDWFICGAGIWIMDASPAFVGCVVRDNHDADHGGGLSVDGGAPTFDDCWFDDNSSYLRGGQGYVVEAQVSFTACVFEGGTTGWGASYDGGALYLERADVEISSCTFLRAIADGSGGAIFATEGLLTVTDTDFLDGSSFDWNGGSLCLDTVDTQLDDCSFTHSRAIDDRLGGALYQQGGTLVANGCHFTACEADGGGAVWVAAGSATLADCHFEDNLASAYFYYPGGSGGALGLALAAEVEITGSVLRANQAQGGGLEGEPGFGGAVYGPARLHRCTLVDNGAVARGGAIAGDAAVDTSILWGNGISPLAGHPTLRYTLIEGDYKGKGNLDLDPRFWDRAGGDLRLMPLSPAIDAGNPAATPDEDGSVADAGAFPYDPAHCGLGCAPLGESYCSSTLNSSGQAATISAQGSAAVADNLLTLHVSGLPTDQPACLLVSESADFVPGWAGGQGNLCLGAPITRLMACCGMALDTGLGEVWVSPDLAALPSGLVILPGETWRFQLWFRDENPQATSNTSDGIALSFL